MTGPTVSSIPQLLKASSDDEQVLSFPIPDAAFGYHAQQAVEKLYKAVIAASGQKYLFIHDLTALRTQLLKDWRDHA